MKTHHVGKQETKEILLVKAIFQGNRYYGITMKILNDSMNYIIHEKTKNGLLKIERSNSVAPKIESGKIWTERLKTDRANWLKKMITNDDLRWKLLR